MGKGGEDFRKPKEDTNPRPFDDNVFPAWAKEILECEKHFGVNKKLGLGSEDVEKRHEKCRWNELEKHAGQSIWSLVVEQFNDTLVRILLVVAVISFILALLDGEEGGEKEITAFEAAATHLLTFLCMTLNMNFGMTQRESVYVVEVGRRVAMERGGD